jgi:hypothetical protein
VLEGLEVAMNTAGGAGTHKRNLPIEPYSAGKANEYCTHSEFHSLVLKKLASFTTISDSDS